MRKQNRNFSKSPKIDEYGTSRAENSSKSISEQFPVDWRPSQTPKFHQIYPNRAQPPDHAPTRVFRPTPPPDVRCTYVDTGSRTAEQTFAPCLITFNFSARNFSFSTEQLRNSIWGRPGRKHDKYQAPRLCQTSWKRQKS